MKRTLLLLTLLCASPLWAHAQNRAVRAQAVDRVTTTAQGYNRRPDATAMNQSILNSGTESAPELFPGELEDVGPQFLVIQRQQRYQWVEVFADSQFYYTSNALLSEKGNDDTGIMVNTAQVTITPPPFSLLGGQASVRAGYRHQIWLYSLDNTANQLNNFDFDVSTVFLGFRHTWNDVWVAGAGIDYNRYLSHDNDWTEFYVELAPGWGLERIFTFGDKATLSAAYAGAYHWTQTDPNPTQHINDRLDNIFALTYTRELCEHVTMQAYYHFQWAHYTENSDRNDIYNTLGLSLAYSPTEWFSVRGFINYENRNSTDDLVADYNKVDAGGGLSLVLRF